MLRCRHHSTGGDGMVLSQAHFLALFFGGWLFAPLDLELKGLRHQNRRHSRVYSFPFSCHEEEIYSFLGDEQHETCSFRLLSSRG